MLCAKGSRTTYDTRCDRSYMPPDPNGDIFSSVWIAVLMRLTFIA